MSYDPHDTIAAIATATGGAARGMVRISGPATADIVARCFVAADGTAHSAIQAPTAVAGRLRVDVADSPSRSLSCDLFFWPTERSYTREPVAELHTFGSPPLLRATLDAVCCAGARLAEPGEFTLRAFLAGRIDLTQAEAVLGVIDAQQPGQLHTAVEQLAGNLARPLHQLREDLLSLLAELEAGLDFVEEDIQFISAAELTTRLQSAQAEIQATCDQITERSTANDHPQIVLMGEPNAGKSSLFNALVQQFGTSQRSTSGAIVSDQRGTTRDYLIAKIMLQGAVCQLIDTAGIEKRLDAAASIDSAAQELSQRQRSQAIVRVFCIDATHNGISTEHDLVDYDAASTIIALTKCDLLELPPASPWLTTSCVTGAGLDSLRDAICSYLAAAKNASHSNCVTATADRCRDSLRLAGTALARASQLASNESGEELVAAEVRSALADIGKVVGAVYTDDLLDRIFKTFCIGK